MHLGNLVPLRPRAPLSDAKIPGYEGVVRKTHTGPGCEKEYDCRSILGKRTYLQCVLAWPALERAGVPGFDSGRSSSYHALILKTKKLPPANISAKECKRLLATAEGDELEVAMLDREAPLLPLQRPLADAPPPLAIAGLEQMVGDDDANSPIPAGLPGDAGVAGEPRDMLADVVGGDDAGPPDAEGGWQGGVPHETMGQRVMRVQGRRDQAWSYYDRLSVRCKNPLHPACVKDPQPGDGQSRPAEFFLGAWLSASDMPADRHKRYAPSRADVRAYTASLDA